MGAESGRIAHCRWRDCRLEVVDGEGELWYDFGITENRKGSDRSMTFGEKLQKLRRESGLSQEKLAEQLNVSRQAVSRWELGTASPDVDNIVRLSKFFQVPIEYLMLEDCEDPAQAGGDVPPKAAAAPGQKEKKEAPKGRKPLWLLVAGLGLEILSYTLCFVMQARDIELFGVFYDEPSKYMVHMPLGWLTAAGIGCLLAAAWTWWTHKWEEMERNKQKPD